MKIEICQGEKLVWLTSEDNIADILSRCISDKWTCIKSPELLRLFFHSNYGEHIKYGNTIITVRVESLNGLCRSFLRKINKYANINIQRRIWAQNIEYIH